MLVVNSANTVNPCSSLLQPITSICLLVNCAQLPPCPYPSPSSCIAVNVPLECPRLCGLCERYEVLKHVFGERNLAPNRPVELVTRPSLTTPERSFPSTKKKSIFRKLKKKLRNRYWMNESTSSCTGLSFSSVGLRIPLNASLRRLSSPPPRSLRTLVIGVALQLRLSSTCFFIA